MDEGAKKPAITSDDLKRMEQMTNEIAEFRKKLAPMTELVVKTLQQAPIWDAIKMLMDFEGKDSIKFPVKIKDGDINRPFEVVFKDKRC